MDKISVGDWVICIDCSTLRHRVGKLFIVSDDQFNDLTFTIRTKCGKLFMKSEVVKATKAQILLYRDEE